MIAIIDYGVGNLGSVMNMLRRIGAEATITSDAAEIAAADGLILPGVGHFDAGMRRLRETGLVEPLTRLVQVEKKPVLGICLGMQLLARGSEEGSEPGLAWIPADVVRFQFGAHEKPLPVPHMGWNDVEPTASPLFAGFATDDARFYFVHSYYVRSDAAADVAGWATYGVRFAAAIQRDNVFGAQFHPEKSHRFGLRLLSNFDAICRAAATRDDRQQGAAE